MRRHFIGEGVHRFWTPLAVAQPSLPQCSRIFEIHESEEVPGGPNPPQDAPTLRLQPTGERVPGGQRPDRLHDVSKTGDDSGRLQTTPGDNELYTRQRVIKQVKTKVLRHRPVTKTTRIGFESRWGRPSTRSLRSLAQGRPFSRELDPIRWQFRTSGESKGCLNPTTTGQ